MTQADRIPEGFLKLNVYDSYIKDDEIVLLGVPDESTNHNCDAMGCGSLDHVLIRCKIPDWQAEQLRVTNAA